MYPFNLLDSHCWKVTLPVGKPGKPTEVTFPALATYTDEWFKLNAAGNGIVFIAPTDGVTTSGSKNPRSELREMSPDGKERAAWSSTVGSHSMEVELSVDALPIGKKPHVVIAQIHDSKDDVVVFRLEGDTSGDRNTGMLWITDGNTTHSFLVSERYRLGDKIRVGFRVEGGVIRFVYNGQLVNYTQAKKVTGCYFKAGCYNQSGGIVTKLPNGKADYAQVTIYKLLICHDGRCMGTVPGSDAPVVVVPPVDPPTPTEPTPPTDLAAQLAVLRTEIAQHKAETDKRWVALKAAIANL